MGPLALIAGPLVQGQAQSNAAQYNATIARQNAAVATSQGVAASQMQARSASRAIGAMVAGQGANGIDSGSGSAMDVLADSVRSATLDNLTTKYNYSLRAQGFNNQATLDDTSAENYRTSGYLNAIGAAAQAGGQMALMGGGGTMIPSYGGGPG